MIGLSLLALLLSGLRACNGHHTVSEIFIDGVNKGLGTCIRVAPNVNPMTDISSPNMACNLNGATQVDFTCPANAGSEVTVHWAPFPDGSKDQPIDPSHQGPCAAYMKYMGPDGKGAVDGPGWFKIWEDGLIDGKFCSDRLRSNDNNMVVTIPKDLAGGYYTLRAESIALHQANHIGGAQFYVSCAQLFVYSTGGSAQPTTTVSIPGYIKATDPGILYDHWSDPPPGYVIPGPAKYISTNSGGGQPELVPFNPHPAYKQCPIQNANWCAVPLPGYTDQTSCWTGDTDCWNQKAECYKANIITGYKGCRDMETFCRAHQNACIRCRTEGAVCQG